MSDKHFHLTVATLNILNDASTWQARRHLIVPELSALAPDLIAWQEVMLPANNAQWLADQLGGYFANIRPYFSLLNDLPHIAQVRRLLDWLPHDVPAVVCGDFNASPRRGSMQLVRQHFISAHAAANGHEPAFTFPSRLHRGPGWRHSARSALLRVGGLAQQRQNAPLHVTVDYIYVDPAIQVRECQIAFHRSDVGNERVFPSDHFGLTAKLELHSA